MNLKARTAMVENAYKRAPQHMALILLGGMKGKRAQAQIQARRELAPTTKLPPGLTYIPTKTSNAIRST